VKRKLVGAFHEETLFGPVCDQTGQITEFFTARKSVLDLKPAHLRLRTEEPEKDAISRLAENREKLKEISTKEARKWAKTVVESPQYKPRLVDPSPGKPGIVRDIGLRKQLRKCLEQNNIDPKTFKPQQIKKLYDAQLLKQDSGVPIKTVVILRTMADPVITPRRYQDYSGGHALRDNRAASNRAYVGGNNHHIEIRQDNDGKLTGKIISAFEAAQRNQKRLSALRAAGVPVSKEFRKLSRQQKHSLKKTISDIGQEHPIIDRSDDQLKGGKFIMSLCEGEMLSMHEKLANGKKGDVSFFVVAKLNKPHSVVLVPHWDARTATERKNSSGEKVVNSKREDFIINPSDLQHLAGYGNHFAQKIRVTALGIIKELVCD
jgi:CRISPR-associated endonuclease Csn1